MKNPGKFFKLKKKLIIESSIKWEVANSNQLIFVWITRIRNYHYNTQIYSNRCSCLPCYCHNILTILPSRLLKIPVIFKIQGILNRALYSIYWNRLFSFCWTYYRISLINYFWSWHLCCPILILVDIVKIYWLLYPKSTHLGNIGTKYLFNLWARVFYFCYPSYRISLVKYFCPDTFACPNIVLILVIIIKIS